MRIAPGIIGAGLMVVAIALSSGTVTAKTYIELTPNSGPTGSSVQVVGFGFATGDVRIALAPLDIVGSGFVDELPEESMVTLADTVAIRGVVEDDVVLPGASDFAWGKQVDILVIQEDPPTSHARFFVAKASFDVTALRELPRAGVGPAGDGMGGTIWPIAFLAAGGALLASAGLRIRSSAA